MMGQLHKPVSQEKTVLRHGLCFYQSSITLNKSVGFNFLTNKTRRLGLSIFQLFQLCNLLYFYPHTNKESKIKGWP